MIPHQIPARITLETSAGFTLVEVLIALVVLAIGMLGIAGLYVEGLRASRSALVRSQAVVMASNMADRIRANRDAGAAYEGTPATEPNSNCGAGGSGCTPAEMAANDLRLWLDDLATALPSGSGSIEFEDVSPTDAIPPAFDIEVSWSEPSIGSQTFQIRVET